MTIGAALCGGCTDSADPSGEKPAETGEQRILSDGKLAQEKGYSEQAAILADGDVSATEYQDAVDLTIKCYKDAGVPVDGPWLSPIDNLILLYTPSIPANTTPKNTAGQACESAYLSFVQPNYLESNPQRMDDNLIAATISCLGEKGVDVDPASKNVKDLVESAGNENQQTVTTCVGDEMHRLHPEITSAFITY